MTRIGSPTKQTILKADQKYNVQVPLTSIENCQYKYCKQNFNYEIPQPQNMHLPELDNYWSELLKAQQNSSANYIYKIKTFGEAQDPTLVKKEPVPTETINRRVLNMSYIGGLLKADLFYLLSFVLNLMKLPFQMQKEYMEYMLKRKLLNAEIINYLQLITRHPSAGLTDKQLQEFQQILQHLKATDAFTDHTSYYNPEHIFLKSINDINPYELEYLNMILHSNRRLTAQQTLYLAKLVFKLQQLECSNREEYLRFLREKHILPFNNFDYLIVFLVTRAKRINRNKLKNLFRELQTLMDIGPCEPEPETVTAKIQKPTSKAIQIDYLRINNALKNLMASAIPNIVHLTDLKNFLKDLMTLSEDQIVKVFNSLKIANIMTLQRFEFVENFIKSRKLGKVGDDKTKQKEFIKLLKFVATSPTNAAVMFEVDAAAPIKGPITQQVGGSKELDVSKTNEKLKNPSSTDTEKNEKETQEQQNKNEIVNKKFKKLAKKSKKNPPKRKTMKKRI